jgi:hypothetical protein
LGKLVSSIICVGQFNHQNYLGTRCKPNSLSQRNSLPSVEKQILSKETLCLVSEKILDKEALCQALKKNTQQRSVAECFLHSAGCPKTHLANHLALALALALSKQSDSDSDSGSNV